MILISLGSQKLIKIGDAMDLMINQSGVLQNDGQNIGAYRLATIHGLREIHSDKQVVLHQWHSVMLSSEFPIKDAI